MKIELVHEPDTGPLPFVLKCRIADKVIQEGFATEAQALAAKPEFAAALRGAFRS